MSELLIVALSFISAFGISAFLTSAWIKIARSAGLTGKDMNKIGNQRIAEGGGIAVVASFAFSVLFYVFLKTFYLHTSTNIVEAFAILSTILLAAFVGFIDDILGWKIGLKQWQKPLLTIPIALPLAVISAGTSVMALPFFGMINFSLLYPLLIVPGGIVGAANGFNILGGLNGLEAGMGAVILSALGVATLLTNQFWLGMIIFSAVAALVAFLFFNWHPAKVFPGDSLTYSVGALIASVAIIGGAEKIAVLLFLPYFIEVVIKARWRFKSECFSVPNPDGSIRAPEKIGSLTHVAMKLLSKIKSKVFERDVVFLFIIGEILLAVLVLGRYFI